MLHLHPLHRTLKTRRGGGVIMDVILQGHTLLE